MNEQRQLALLWLAMKLGPVGQRHALAWIQDDRFFERTKQDWQSSGLTEAQSQALTGTKGRKQAERTLLRMQQEGIQILLSGQDDFPYSLPTAEYLPPILFIKGSQHAWRRAGLAVVGTRKPSGYGLEMAKEIACEAALRGIPVVSGAALGVDTAAHRGALQAGGLTVAVLGCGLFHTYPPSARELLERIAENGVLVSQFDPERRPDKSTFPIRNQVIAALSEGVVIVEGLLRSGAAHTARFAGKMQLPLYALPGDITRPQAQLPNRLITEGAVPILMPADPVDPVGRKQAGQAELPLQPTRKQARSKSGLSPKDLSALPELQRRLVSCINEGSGSVDELLSAGLGEAGEINQALLQLELSGLLRQEPGRRYALNKPVSDS